jgi:hypothetical protein
LYQNYSQDGDNIGKGQTSILTNKVGEQVLPEISKRASNPKSYQDSRDANYERE